MKFPVSLLHFMLTHSSSELHGTPSCLQCAPVVAVQLQFKERTPCKEYVLSTIPRGLQPLTVSLHIWFACKVQHLRHC